MNLISQVTLGIPHPILLALIKNIFFLFSSNRRSCEIVEIKVPGVFCGFPLWIEPLDDHKHGPLVRKMRFPQHS